MQTLDGEVEINSPKAVGDPANLEECIDLGRDRYHQGRGLPNLMQMLLSV